MTLLSAAFIVPLLAAGVRMAMPILLAATGEIYAERSGVLNINLEGQMLVGAFGAKRLFCGQDFSFGAGRAGNTALLAALAGAHGVVLEVVPMAEYAGAPISASRIRGALAAGEMERAAAMLGRPYAIDFPVEHGRQLGSRLGFPTINQLFPPGVQAPAFGVYITQAVVGGRAWPAATGYGTRPTVDGGAPTCETFIPGFEGDLYGRAVTVRFYKRIAETTRFEGPRQLAEAVQGWAAQALAYFAGDKSGDKSRGRPL